MTDINNRYNGVPHSDVTTSHVNLRPGMLNLRDTVRSSEHQHLSSNARKPVFDVSDQVHRKNGLMARDLKLRI